jgi:anti-sigma factor RsiW
MSCDPMIWTSKLDAYVDGEGSPQERSAIEVHLRDCPACAADALGRLQLKRSIQSAATRFTPSPQFAQLIQKTIQQQPRPEPKRRALLSFPWMPTYAAPLALAALLLIVASTALWTRHTSHEQALADLVDLHVSTLASANPVDVVSTDRHTVKPWFQGKLPFTFNLPELQDSQFKLLGGKLVYVRHTPGAQLLFEVRSHKLSVFIFQDLPGTITPAATAREVAFNSESWTDGGLRFIVVSDTSPADVHALSELLKTAAHP